MNTDCNSLKASNLLKNKNFFNLLQAKYQAKFLTLTAFNTKTPSITLGKDIIALINQFNREILNNAERQGLEYIDFANISTNELRQSIKFIDTIANIRKNENNKIFFKNHNSVVSFNGVKKELTDKQKSECRYVIHSYSLVCAGISAFMGEACAAGADIPFLITTEAGMFTALAGVLNVPLSPAMLHATRHMWSAGIVGGNVLKLLNSVASLGGHIMAAPTTAGVGNVAISSYLRASNAALSASFCEYMGWAFVDDYKKGLMNTKQKTKELIAFGAFSQIMQGFNSYLDLEKPASMLEHKLSEAFGMSFASNLSNEHASFVNQSMKLLAKHPFSLAAKGIEIVTPALAAHLIENDGKLNNQFLGNLIKGSIYSLVCGQLLGDSTNDYKIKDKSKQYIGYMMNDPYIQKLIEEKLVINGIKSYGAYKLDNKTLNSLESIYNELTPRIADIIKKTRGL